MIAVDNVFIIEKNHSGSQKESESMEEATEQKFETITDKSDFKIGDVAVSDTGDRGVINDVNSDAVWVKPEKNWFGEKPTLRVEKSDIHHVERLWLQGMPEGLYEPIEPYDDMAVFKYVIVTKAGCVYFDDADDTPSVKDRLPYDFNKSDYRLVGGNSEADKS